MREESCKDMKKCKKVKTYLDNEEEVNVLIEDIIRHLNNNAVGKIT